MFPKNMVRKVRVKAGGAKGGSALPIFGSIQTSMILTNSVRLKALDWRLAKKALQGCKFGTKEILGGTKENSVFPDNQWSFLPMPSLIFNLLGPPLVKVTLDKSSVALGPPNVRQDIRLNFLFCGLRVAFPNAGQKVLGMWKNNIKSCSALWR